MNATTERLLAVLASVSEAGSSLEPKWDPYAATGYVYPVTPSALDDASLLPELEELARRNYLERTFVDRISLCPSCESHALSVREICIECHSSNIAAVETLVHFRCAFVGPASMFLEDAMGRRCPKCRRILQELGTDFASPGDSFSCRACNATFQVPDVGALCLSCGARFAADEMKAIKSREVYAYRLTGLGRSALREGRLLEDGREALYERDDSVYRRHALVDAIEDECRRRRTLGTNFGLIALQSNGDGMVPQMRQLLTEADKLGRFDDRLLVAILPGANRWRTRAVLQRLRRLSQSAVTVEGAEVNEILRRIEDVAEKS